MAEKKKNKIEKRYGFDRGFIRLLRYTVVPVLKLRYGVKKSGNLTLPGEPCVVLYNHVTDLDIVWVMDAFREQMYCVASEHVVRLPVAGKLISLFFAPILIKKGTSGAGAVMEIFRHLKAGHHVLMAPEGVRSGNGLTAPLVHSTAAVLKRLHCSIVTVRIHGGYFTTPRWGKGIRRGEITVEKIAEYSKEQIASMHSRELRVRLAEDLYEDAYAYNEVRKIAYKGHNLAEGIETAFYQCPSCKNYFTIRSWGNSFFCPCGLKGSMDEYGKIKGERIPFETVTEWDTWENDILEAEFKRVVDGNREGAIFTTPDLEIREIFRNHKKEVMGKGALTLFEDYLEIGPVKIPIPEIEDVSIIAYGILLVFTKDSHYYEIKGKHRYPGEVYMNCIRKIKGEINV